MLFEDVDDDDNGDDDDDDDNVDADDEDDVDDENIEEEEIFSDESDDEQDAEDDSVIPSEWYRRALAALERGALELALNRIVRLFSVFVAVSSPPSFFLSC